MRILLTGGRGMVGSNFREHPVVKMFEVFAPSSRELDLRDGNAVQTYVTQHQPDIIIHAAGYVGGIQANMREPLRFLIDNLDMGRNIVWAARQAGIKRLINLGSSCMYPREIPNPITEDQLLRGAFEPTNEGYALAKNVVARLCLYIQQDNPEYQYKTIIPCNLYGRYDTFEASRSHLMPAIIAKLHKAILSKAESVEIWGDGTARREFLYAGDLADCLVQAVQRFDTLPNIMNVGMGYDLTVNDYYRMSAEATGYTGVFTHNLAYPVGINAKLMSITKMEIWGWQPRTSLQEGIRKTYAFYKDFKT